MKYWKVFSKHSHLIRTRCTEEGRLGCLKISEMEGAVDRRTGPRKKESIQFKPVVDSFTKEEERCNIVRTIDVPDN